MSRWLTLILLTVATASASGESFDTLAAAIQARLQLMPDVARYKWNRGLPIADPAREAELVARFEARATTLSIDATCARRAIEAQLAASRAWQARLVERWQSRTRRPFKGVPDLAKRLRPAIDVATERLLIALRDTGCRADAATSAPLMSPPAALAEQADIWSLAVAPWVETSMIGTEPMQR